MATIVRVLIVDDSKAMCKFLSEIMSKDPEIEVVGYALDPFEARSMIKTMQPDVITLDVEMPRMDGITFLKNLMRLRPMPVVMLSSLTAAGAAVTLEALSIGAVDFLVKRHPGSSSDYENYVQDINQRVKNAGRTKVAQNRSTKKPFKAKPEFGAWQAQLQEQRPLSKDLRRVVAIGSSTGGPEAVREVLENLYLPDCSLVLTQHMPANFMAPFAERLDSLSRFRVMEAQDNQPLEPGSCYVAPGDHHLSFKGRDSSLRMHVSPGELCSGHRPSVDVMFSSLAKCAGKSSVGLLLTGMGKDGANGMLHLRDAGALNLVQDKHTSAVWGMPGSAVALDAAHGILGLHDIAPTIESLLEVS